VRYTYHDAWVLVDGAWHQIESAFALITAVRLTKQAYRAMFGPVPRLPKIAFQNPPVRAMPPSFGSEDGIAVRFTHDEAWGCFKGEWREWSVTDAVCKAALLTEAAYRKRFGDLPPLPAHAFRGDPWVHPADRREWSSPLI
jgi:hypothetical protein